MVSLLIRNVDKALHSRLRARAAERRRSLEEEARELLRTALARQETEARDNIVDIAQRLFGPEHGAELDTPPRGRAPETPPPEFDER